MVFRSDISVDWTQSPRLIFVAAPSTSITIQDLIDTLRFLEERPWEGLVFPQIIEAAGKEDLGGGVKVGITAKLLNARLAFEARKISIESGTITTADTNGVTINDSTALFITNGIEPGSWVVNLNDGSRATVLRVVSEIQIITDGLGDGIDNQFNSGDLYEIQNVIQCEVNGGNIVAVGADGVTPISAILPTMGIQAVRTASSSATIQEQTDIQFSSFGGAVHVNLMSPYSGTEFPIGTSRQKVNNWIDALAIADARGLGNFHVHGTTLIDSGLNFTDKNFYGSSPSKTYFIVDTAAQVLGCEFYDASIEGILDGYSSIRRCNIFNLNYISGFVYDCILNDTITLLGDAHFLNCMSGIPGATPPIIDFNNSVSSLSIRDYNGGIKLINKSGSEPVSIDLNSGQIIIDSTVTNGTITCRGTGKIIDNSTGSAIVDSTYLVSPISVANAVWDDLTANHTAPGSMGEAIASAGLTSEQAKQLLIIFINSLK